MKTKLLSIFALFGLFAAASTSVKVANSLSIFELDNSFDLHFETVYEGLPAYSDIWKTDVYDSNFMTISPESGNLGVGEQNVSCDGVGYVVYKFDAPSNKSFSYLELNLIGRVFHYNGGGTCAQGTCTCGMDILVSEDGTNYAQVNHENAGTNGSQDLGFRYNLTDYVRGFDSSYIKIQIDGKSWDWINLQRLNVNGRYRDRNIGIYSSSITNTDGSETLVSGNNVNITYTLSNTSDSDFTGVLALSYPEYYLSAESDSLSVSIPAKSTATYSFNAVLNEGGYGSINGLLYNGDNTLFDRYEMKPSATGYGVYLADGHSHSFVSDGRNDFYSNYLQAIEKGYSAVLSTDHDAPCPGDDTDIQNAAARARETTGANFVAVKGSEVTTEGNSHILCYNFSTEFPSLSNSQQVIDSVINQGGYSYLAHPFLPGYLNKNLGDDPTRVDAVNNMTGIEIYNGESNFVRDNQSELVPDNLEYWDRLNITGKKKFFGIGGSDAHDSIMIGTIGNAFILDDLSIENITDAIAKGRFYVTTGTSMRFTIDGMTFGETVRVNDTKQGNIKINVFDPNYAIKKVDLYRFDISSDNDQAFDDGRSSVQTLYEYHEGEQKIYSFNYNNTISLKNGEFYRVVAYTERASFEWGRNFEGVCYSNPIWVEQEIACIDVTSSPTNTSIQQYHPLDLSGLEWIATYNDGSTKPIKGWIASGFDSTVLGETSVTISYEGFSEVLDYTIVEEQGVVHVIDGKIDFYKNFEDMPAYSMDWSKDAGCDGAGGMLCISPSQKGLGVGKQNVSSSGSGWVSYRLAVPEGNIVNTLTTEIKGRFYHSGSNSNCKNGTCSCCFEIYTSVDGGVNYTQVVDYELDNTTSSWNRVLNYDLSSSIGNSHTVIVKIVMACNYWDWCCIQSLRFNGTYVEGQSIPVAKKGDIMYSNGTISYEKDFTTYPQYDTKWAEEPAVYETTGNLTISPSTRCLGVGKKNSSSAGTGTVSYKIQVPETNVITTLSLILHGRFYHSSTSEVCSNGTCTCDFKVALSVDDGQIYHTIYDHDINFTDSKFGKEINLNLNESIQNRDSAIIRIYMSGRSWDWIGITDLAISGTYATGEAIHDVVLKDSVSQVFDEFGRGSEEWKQYAYSYQDVCITREGEKPWLGVDPSRLSSWNTVGNIVYKLTSSTGCFEDLNVVADARVFSYEGSDAMFKAYYSFDNEHYELFYEAAPTTNGGEIAHLDDSLGDVVKGKECCYIKFEMVSGWWDWVCIKDIFITGLSVSSYGSLVIKDLQGNIISNTDEFYNKTCVNKDDYAKDGYETKLYYDQNKEHEYNGERLEGNNTLYIDYSAIEYTITFEGNFFTPATYTVESELDLPIPSLTEREVFVGWYDNPDFTGDSIDHISKGTTGNLHLYAKIIRNESFYSEVERMIEEVTKYKSKDDYEGEFLTMYDSIISDFIAVAQNATCLTDIVNKYEETLLLLDKLPTKADAALKEAKTYALGQLNEYLTSLDPTLYTTENWNKLNALAESGRMLIEQATDIDSVTRVLKETISAMSRVEQIQIESSSIEDTSSIIEESSSEEESSIYESSIIEESSDIVSSDDSSTVISSEESTSSTVSSDNSSLEISTISVSSEKASSEESIVLSSKGSSLPSINSSSSNNEDNPTNGGCGGSIIACSALVSLLSLVGLGIVIKRKKY